MSEQPVNDNPKDDIKPVGDDDVSVKRIRSLLSFLSILLVMVSQIILYTSPVREDIGMPLSSTIDPVSMQINITIALLIVGVLLFVFSQGYQPPRFLRAWFDRAPSIPGVVPWVLASLALSLVAVLSMLLFEKAQLKNYIPVVTIWFFAGLCYAAGFMRNRFSVPRWREWLKLHWIEILALGLLTLFGIALRFYALGDIPRVVNGDEGRLGIAALSTNTYPFVNPFSLWENFGALYLQAVNLCLTYFGTTPFALRIAAAIGGTLAIPAIYLLARQISGARVAFIAAALIAISHDHLHFSRTVAVAYIQGTWLIPLEFYFLLSGITKRSSWRAALGGMLLAFHYCVYLDAQITTALILVYLLIAFLFMRPWIKPALRQVAVFWGGFAIMFLPELTFIIEHPGDFFNRLTKDGMFQTNWLPQEIANTGHNVYQILAQRVVHVFLSMIYYPAFDFYGASVPVLSRISAVLFLLGLGIVLW
ncbi:MAG: glycosyltransferase family 39 protein, partial [Anaerolineales bacterium]